MPLVDHFLGNLGGPIEAGGSTLGIWFDGNESTVGVVVGMAISPVWDLGAEEQVDEVRIRWSFGDLDPGHGAAGAFALEVGDSATGPWTEVLADADPAATAGVSYPQDFEILYPLGVPGQWWRFRSTTFSNNDIVTVNGFEDEPEDPDEPPEDPGYTPPGPGRALLEIYVHDEDASRWGTATWATGPATGTEGIWSGAGWQDVTPQGVNVHWIWGSRRPERGILAEQDGASVNIETYDPDRVLDPGNPDSPYAPQILPGVPVRVVHEASGLIIRTGYLEVISYNHKAPDYQGQALGTDSIALMHKAEVPEDATLGDVLVTRIQDAIDAAGIAVGGLPVRPRSLVEFVGVPLSPRIEGPASVWEHARRAGQERLVVVYVDSLGELGLRAWGSPLDRGREIGAGLLEDLQSLVSEDGTYSAVRVKNEDGTSVIERHADPLPRYGIRVYERDETTVDPEAWADAVLADRAWPGVQYVPGAIHAFTAADVDMLGSLQTMERVQLVTPDVSVSGRILGGELWVEQRANAPKGAKWIFQFAVATDGSSAVGLTTLVSSQGGDTLVDSQSGADYLEAN